MGFVLGEVRARDDASYLELLRRFFAFYRASLMGPTWGEHVVVRPRNALGLTLSFVGLTAEQAQQQLKPWMDTLAKEPDRFTTTLQIVAAPGDKVWDRKYAEEHLAAAIQPDTRPGAMPDTLWWWKSNQGEVATYWYTYQSRWLPKALFEPQDAGWAVPRLNDRFHHVLPSHRRTAVPRGFSLTLPRRSRGELDRDRAYCSRRSDHARGSFT